MKHLASCLRALLSITLLALLPCASIDGLGQQAAPAPSQPHSLFITVLDGEGALNDVRERTAREPIVEIDDENHKPVAGALVLFAVDNPSSGTPFATFSGESVVSVQTNEAGRAVGRGFQVGTRRGQFTIRIRASKGQTAAETTIAETNLATILNQRGVERSNHVSVFSNKKLDWLLGTAAAGGIAAGLVIALSGHQTSITPGTGTVGAPAAIPGVHFQLGRPRH